MTKYEVKAVVCDYGIYENGELRLVINSQTNALLIKYVLEQDLKHKIVINDLLEPKTKPKHKFRTMTCGEFCTKWLLKHKFCKHLDEYCCPLVLSKACFKENANKPCKVNGKYILVEVKENEYTRNY